MPATTYTTLPALIDRVNEHMTTNGAGENTGARTNELLQEIALSLVAIIGAVPPDVIAAFPAWSAVTTYVGGREDVVSHAGKLWLFVSPVDSLAQTPGTDGLVWQEFSALSLAHMRNKDQAVDQGGPNECTAADLRALLDQYGVANALTYQVTTGAPANGQFKWDVAPEVAGTATAIHIGTTDIAHNGLATYLDSLTPGILVMREVGGSGLMVFNYGARTVWPGYRQFAVTPVYSVGTTVGAVWAMSFAPAPAGTIELGPVLYVSSAIGSDITGVRGRLDKPFATLGAAYTASMPNDVIWVIGSGTYQLNKIIGKSLTIYAPLAVIDGTPAPYGVVMAENAATVARVIAKSVNHARVQQDATFQVFADVTGQVRGHAIGSGIIEVYGTVGSVYMDVATENITIRGKVTGAITQILGSLTINGEVGGTITKTGGTLVLKTGPVSAIVASGSGTISATDAYLGSVTYGGSGAFPALLAKGCHFGAIVDRDTVTVDSASVANVGLDEAPGGVTPADVTAAITAHTAAIDPHGDRAYTDTQVASEATSRNAAISAAIAALIDSAPGALDTINELAAALGDDPNAIATLTAAIAGKEATLPAGTASQYLRGDKTMQDMAAAVAATPAVTANTAKVSNATHTGDVTGATALTIGNDKVTNAKAANMPAQTIKGNDTAGSADPKDLTVAQAKVLLNYTKSDMGLSLVDNTSDLGKPVSTAQSAAIASAVSTHASAVDPHGDRFYTDSQVAAEVTNRNAAISAAIATLIDSAPGALDTLNELAAALGDDPNAIATLTTAIAGKAPLGSPALTGTPTAPTASALTNNTQVATTAYVDGAVATGIAAEVSDRNVAIAAAAVGDVKSMGSYDASVNHFPTSGGSGSGGAVMRGNRWMISVAGTADGVALKVGDLIEALADGPGDDETYWRVDSARDVATTAEAENRATADNESVMTPVQCWKLADKSVGASPLTGLMTTDSADVAPTDTPLEALGKLQAQMGIVRGTKWYRCVLTGQAGSAAPTVGGLAGTIGVTWGRSTAGTYTATAAAGTFVANKTRVYVTNGYDAPASFVQASRNSATVVGLTTRNSSGTLADDQIVNCSVWIIVEP